MQDLLYKQDTNYCEKNLKTAKIYYELISQFIPEFPITGEVLYLF